jgi:hypothetical protein
MNVPAQHDKHNPAGDQETENHMKLSRLGAFTAATIGALAFAAAPASAHATTTFHGNDYGHVTDNHRRVLAYDGECDDHYVDVEYRYRVGTGSQIRLGNVRDINGCRIGNNSHLQTRIYSYRVCEAIYSGANISCSGWRTT